MGKVHNVVSGCSIVVFFWLNFMHACLDVELTNSELTNGNLLYEEFVYLVSQKTSAHVVNGLPPS